MSFEMNDIVSFMTSRRNGFIKNLDRGWCEIFNNVEMTEQNDNNELLWSQCQVRSTKVDILKSKFKIQPKLQLEHLVVKINWTNDTKINA